MPRLKNEIVVSIQNYWKELNQLREHNKRLIESSTKLIEAMDQYSFFVDGYKNGSASISEAQVAGRHLDEVKTELFELLQKIKTC